MKNELTAEICVGSKTYLPKHRIKPNKRKRYYWNHQ